MLNTKIKGAPLIPYDEQLNELRGNMEITRNSRGQSYDYDIDTIFVVSHLEAKNWLNKLPDDSVRTWDELEESFFELFYRESIELHMTDDICAHKQPLGEAMHDTWWRFSQNMNKCPNNGLWVLRAPDSWAITTKIEDFR